MPAQPARPIERLSGDRQSVIMDDYPDGLPLGDLSHVELIRTAKLAFPETRGNAFMKYGNQALIAAITSGVLPYGIDDEPVKAPRTQDRTPQGEIPPITLSTPVPAESEPGSIEAAIRALVARTAVPASIDEGAVRSIVQGETDAILSIVDDRVSTVENSLYNSLRELAAELSRPVVNEIHLPDREPITLDERTHTAFEPLLKLLNAGLHVYLVGPPGTGKSTLASQCAKALERRYGAISCHAMMTATSLFGYMDANGRYVRVEFRECYEHGGVFLLDEIDNGNPNILASVNQALANGECAFPDGMVKRHPDFVLIAAANTYGTGATRQFIGRNALDAATLDRFVMLTIDIDEQLERDLTLAESPEHGEAWLTLIRRLRGNAASHGLQVVISPRAAIEGARMRATGFSEADTLDMRVTRGLTADQVSKVVG